MVEENKKYQSLMENAWLLFRRFGVRKVNVEEICREAEVSKMTFYNYFRNKWDLLEKLVQVKIDDMLREYDAMIQSDIPFMEKIESLIAMKIKQAREFEGPLLAEIMAENSRLRSFLDKQWESSKIKSSELFLLGQKSGCIRSDMTENFFLFLLEGMSGIFEEKKVVEIYPESSMRVKAILDFFFFGVTGRSENRGNLQNENKPVKANMKNNAFF